MWTLVYNVLSSRYISMNILYFNIHKWCFLWFSPNQQKVSFLVLALHWVSESKCVDGLPANAKQRRTWKSGTYEMFLVLWSMLIQELHDATRETLRSFSRTILNHPCQPKHDCNVYAYCAAPLLIIAFKQNAAFANFFFCKTMHIIAYICYTQILYNTNTYLWTASNVRIPTSRVIKTDFWCVRKWHAVKLCMYFYHFITMGASGENV